MNTNIRRDRQRRRAGIVVVFVLAALLTPQFTYACAVCFGDPGAPMTKGASNGIAFLLGTVIFVQIGFVAMFWSFWRRAQTLRRRREAMRVIPGGLIR
jgi:hypothetical protein